MFEILISYLRLESLPAGNEWGRSMKCDFILCQVDTPGVAVCWHRFRCLLALFIAIGSLLCRFSSPGFAGSPQFVFTLVLEGCLGGDYHYTTIFWTPCVVVWPLPICLYFSTRFSGRRLSLHNDLLDTLGCCWTPPNLPLLYYSRPFWKAIVTTPRSFGRALLSLEPSKFTFTACWEAIITTRRSFGRPLLLLLLDPLNLPLL